MASTFANVARVAIDEMLRKHLKVSKFGYFIGDEELAALTDEFLGFLETSRSLKAAGDRFMSGASPGPQKKGLPERSL